MGARIYAPRSFLSPAWNAALDSTGIDVVDTTPLRSDGEVDDAGRHPLALADVAVHAVQRHREELERELALSWCNRSGGEMLFVDGGISGDATLAASRCVAGVVKTHRSLYCDAAALQTVLTLGAGERSTVFTVTPADRWRSPVASWYLRLRDPAGHDPLWGLVRVEIAPFPSGTSRAALAARADEISRWILAEASPLALPDSRWHAMVYGIRDCEEFLRACR
jgi:hypothetical protein